MIKHRFIYPELEKQKENGKITILIGARQVGKTTLMRQLYDSLKHQHPALFLDLDIYSHYEQVRTYENIINTLKLKGYDTDQSEFFFLFLDEFQRYSDISRGLKAVCDHHPNVKIYASGSSSLAINEQIQESLAGRKRILRIYPLGFREYLHFTERDDLLVQLGNLSKVNADNLPSLIPDAYRELERFLVYGGYPEVALTKDPEKSDVLASIFDLYVKKDLVDFLNVDRIQQAKTLIRHLAVNHGQESRYSRLSQVAGVDQKTAKNYIEIVKETFIITVHPPWFTNRNKELVKMPKIYYLDNGVRNYFINNFNPVEIRADTPFLFEGFVISELIKAGVPVETIKFWRTKTKHEVDLVLDEGGRIKPVEIKFKKKLKPSDLKGLDRFKEAYPDCGPQFVVNLGTNRSPRPGIEFLSPFSLAVLGHTLNQQRSSNPNTAPILNSTYSGKQRDRVQRAQGRQ